jgi:tetratricopeptide (TPR) repeat protein
VELIRRHRYEEAIAVFDKDLEGAKQDEKALRALKGQSLAYLRLGSLYDVFSRFSLAIMEDYYSNLIQEGASGLNHLYLGQIQFRLGKFAEAKASLEAAKKLGGPGVGDMADIFHFFARRRLGEAGASGDPGLSPKDNAAQWQLAELLGKDGSGLSAASQRARRCKLEILARNPSVPEADLKSVLKAVLNDAQQPEMYLDQGKNTQINFYDPFLLGTLSDGFYAMSRATNLRIKEAEKRFPDLAAKFGTDLALAEAGIRLGLLKEASGFLGSATSLEAGLLKAQLLARQRKAKEAGEVLDGLSREAKTPQDKRDVADVYLLLGVDTEKGMKLAAAAVKDRNGPVYHRTLAGLMFAGGQTEAAIAQYAKGYKIEYRNRIDQIDPEYMVDYSFAIFRTNKLRYEEIVETLYHLQKEFPSCRQMHYCMQGISAALARSYESQRIFRKGG